MQFALCTNALCLQLANGKLQCGMARQLRILLQFIADKWVKDQLNSGKCVEWQLLNDIRVVIAAFVLR
jgi:hypothetical protein